MHESNPDCIQDMNVPVCIFLPSEPGKGEAYADNVVRDMRDLFVTINTEAQKVSGHFRDLLNDKKVSCACVRKLADTWKTATDATDRKQSRLHLLEWNQREDKLANQRNTPYSVTTVSILREILDGVFSTYGCSQLLRLDDEKAALETLSTTKVDEIENDTFGPCQLPKIVEQADKHLVPALDCLLRQPLPYQKMESLLNQTLANVGDDKRRTGVNCFLKRFFEFRQGLEGYDDADSLAVEEAFLRSIREKSDPTGEHYLKNVFQAGLINSWAEMYHAIVRSCGMSAVQWAEVFVASLNEFCFIGDKTLFSPEKAYTQSLLFDGLVVKVTERSKRANGLLTTMSLSAPASTRTLRNKLDGILTAPKVGRVVREVEEHAEALFKEYRDLLWRQRAANMARNWRLDDRLPEKVRSRLQTAATPQAVRRVCEDFVETEVNKAMDVLRSTIGHDFQTE